MLCTVDGVECGCYYWRWCVAVPTQTHTSAWLVFSLLEASEEIQERLTEANVHKAIRDGIAARRRIGQQLEEAYRSVAEVLVDNFMIKQRDCVDYVERRPADEELQHNDEQHLDDALLVEQTLLGV